MTRFIQGLLICLVRLHVSGVVNSLLLGLSRVIITVYILKLQNDVDVSLINK